MFKDYAKIELKAGDGGDGAISFHHEKYIDRGGPDGGDGGRGGNIYFIADKKINSLQYYVQQKKFYAPDGKNGAKCNRAGAKGDDLYLSLPIGTILYEIDSDGKPVAIKDFSKSKSKYLAARGGKGGFGNAHFTSSTRQTPRFREFGTPGERKKYFLELKTIADIGLVGLPNAGKSTFLSVVTDARPKIADYPFTTISPNLGILSHKKTRLTIADIPGLIKGAHTGKGLGHDFLRHIERTRLILHLIDINSIDPIGDYYDIREELEKFSQKMSKKMSVICFTKIDQLGWTPESVDLKEYLADFKRQTKTKDRIFAISSVSHLGLEKLKNFLISQKSKLSPEKINITRKKNNTKTIDSYVIKLSNGVYGIRGTKIEEFSLKTDFTSFEAMRRLRDIIHKMGLDRQLKKLSIQTGDIVQIGSKQFEW